MTPNLETEHLLAMLSGRTRKKRREKGYTREIKGFEAAILFPMRGSTLVVDILKNVEGIYASGQHFKECGARSRMGSMHAII